jgi:hypothetical protein
MSELNKKANYKKAILKEPVLEVKLNDNAQIMLDVRNLPLVVLKFYIIDVETLFSRTPFLKDNTEEFSYVKPFFVLEKSIQGTEG